MCAGARPTSIHFILEQNYNPAWAFLQSARNEHQTVYKQCESWLSAWVCCSAAMAGQQNLPVPVATASVTALSDGLTDGLQWAASYSSTAKTSWNAMTSEENLNM